MRSNELRLPGTGRRGVGDRSSRFSGSGLDVRILLALRNAPSLAAEVGDAGGGALGSRAGDLDAASRAAICSGAGESDEAEVRPRVLTGGESGLAVNLPILSLTEPTSGPGSDPVGWRTIS
jgi:hypothetical protein